MTQKEPAYLPALRVIGGIVGVLRAHADAGRCDAETMRRKAAGVAAGHA